MITVLVPYHRDEELLPGLRQSIAPLGWPVIALPGAWELFGDTPTWASEAEKRTALLRLCNTPWALFLDSDERLEFQSAGAVDSAIEALRESTLWATVRIYRPDHPHAPEGFPLPRILRTGEAVGFVPPRDFEVWRDGRRIAFLDGEPIPEDLAGAWQEISPYVLRIRHERRLRPRERHEENARYQQRRRELHGTP